MTEIHGIARASAFFRSIIILCFICQMKRNTQYISSASCIVVEMSPDNYDQNTSILLHIRRICGMLSHRTDERGGKMRR